MRSKSVKPTPEEPSPPPVDFSEELHMKYTRMAGQFKDMRDEFAETLDEEDNYKGPHVLQIIDNVMEEAIHVIEQNMAKPSSHKGLGDIYFDMVNS